MQKKIIGRFGIVINTMEEWLEVISALFKCGYHWASELAGKGKVHSEYFSPYDGGILVVNSDGTFILYTTFSKDPVVVSEDIILYTPVHFFRIIDGISLHKRVRRIIICKRK